MRSSLLTAVCGLLATHAHQGIAQTMRGTVVAPDSVTPVVGVIIVAVDEWGRTRRTRAFRRPRQLSAAITARWMDR